MISGVLAEQSLLIYEI